MSPFKKVFEKLQELDIKYQLVEHEPATTIELADKFVEGIEGVRTKTLFITNKKKTNFYLIITDEFKRLDMKELREILAETPLKMASEEILLAKMNLTPGIVSPFGLLANQEHDITVYFDNAIMKEERMSFHPNTNEKTLFLATKDVIRFLEAIGYPPKYLDI